MSFAKKINLRNNYFYSNLINSRISQIVCNLRTFFSLILENHAYAYCVLSVCVECGFRISVGCILCASVCAYLCICSCANLLHLVYIEISSISRTCFCPLSNSRLACRRGKIRTAAGGWGCNGWNGDRFTTHTKQDMLVAVFFTPWIMR